MVEEILDLGQGTWAYIGSHAQHAAVGALNDIADVVVVGITLAVAVAAVDYEHAAYSFHIVLAHDRLEKCPIRNS